MTNPTKSRILVVGGGFGGVRTAEKLSRRPDTSVTLVSATNAFSYYPQLYHAATGGSRSESSLPLADLLDGSNIIVRQDTLTALDETKKVATMASGEHLDYDYLVLALGCVTNYFGITGLAEYSHDIKTIEGAERFKKHLHDQLMAEHKPELDYVIVGAGPTGVELAAALGEYLHRIVRLHGIKHGNYRIDLIEAGPRILPRSSERTAAMVQKRLEKLGIKIMTGSVVEQETADKLIMKDATIRSRTVVWTAGVSNNPFFKAHNNIFALAKNGKVEVDAHLQGTRDVYVIGDNAATKYSGLAQTAIYDADYVAADLAAILDGRARRDYRPKLPASVIPVGSYWAAAQVGRFEIFGFVGWLLRRAADLIAYSDIESQPQALAIWLREFVREDDCVVCEPDEGTKVAA